MIDLLPCAEEHRWQIYAWRNLPDVRRYMYTTEEIPKPDHEQWYDALLSANDRQGWVIRLAENPVGAAFMTGIDQGNRRATWAFYLADSSTRGRGVGGAVEYLILEHAFTELKLHKLCCEVLSFNEAVVAMHKKFGFVEEGLLIDHWMRDGEFANTHLLAMFEDTWAGRRDEVGRALRERGLVR